MFNLSGSEIFFLLLIALVVLGPEKLPEAMRRFGKTYSEIKKMSSGFQSELKTALDEPMREMRDTADALRKAASFDLDGDGVDTSVTKGSTNGMAAATPAGNEPPLAHAAPFQSVVISGGSPTARSSTSSTSSTSSASAEPAVPAADATPAAPPEAPATPIVRAPGINFGSANPRPTAASIVPAGAADDVTAAAADAAEDAERSASAAAAEGSAGE